MKQSVIMADLQCIEAVKNRTRAPSQNLIEAADQGAVTLPRKERKDKLYEIEIVAEDGPRVKVHYLGYESKYDEWKLKDEVVLKQPENSICRDFHPLTELACQIKRKLHPSRHEDPDVRIQVPGTKESFSQLEAIGKCKSNNKLTVSSYNDLVPLLGEKWFIRVTNRIGDFSYVVLPTVEFYLSTPRNLLEYDIKTNKDGTLSFEPMYMEQCYSIVFKFVRGDGNRQKLSEFLYNC